MRRENVPPTRAGARSRCPNGHARRGPEWDLEGPVEPPRGAATLGKPGKGGYKGALPAAPAGGAPRSSSHHVQALAPRRRRSGSVVALAARGRAGAGGRGGRGLGVAVAGGRRDQRQEGEEGEEGEEGR